MMENKTTNIIFLAILLVLETVVASALFSHYGYPGAADGLRYYVEWNVAPFVPADLFVLFVVFSFGYWLALLIYDDIGFGKTALLFCCLGVSVMVQAQLFNQMLAALMFICMVKFKGSYAELICAVLGILFHNMFAFVVLAWYFSKVEVKRDTQDFLFLGCVAFFVSAICVMFKGHHAMIFYPFPVLFPFMMTIWALCLCVLFFMLSFSMPKQSNLFIALMLFGSALSFMISGLELDMLRSIAFAEIYALYVSFKYKFV